MSTTYRADRVNNHRIIFSAPATGMQKAVIRDLMESGRLLYREVVDAALGRPVEIHNLKHSEASSVIRTATTMHDRKYGTLSKDNPNITFKGKEKR